ncbi:MAG: DUF2085 domain-containing protein [Candidatus Altiarchaeota archaeon]|nr:DUF2085 domain-containing protein [Candidatus Altiarchaeota archaeon]
MARLFDRMADKLDAMYEQKTFDKARYDAETSLSRAVLWVKHLFYAWLFMVFLSFVLLVLASPVLIRSENRILLGMGALAYNIVSGLMMCHQLPMRSLFINGVQQAVCARDAGIYLGIVIGGFVFLKGVPSFLKTKKFLVMATIPIALDGVTQTIFNLRESNNALRIITGLIFGFGIMVFVLARIRSLNQSEFRQNIRSAQFKFLLAALLIITASAFIKASALAGDSYTSQNEAIYSAGKTPSSGILSYYIPPRSPLSLYFYPQKEQYADNVLNDLWSMDFLAENIRLLTNDSYLFNQTDNLDLNLPLKHYYGLWVVVSSEGGEGITGEPTVFTSDRGNYYYLDAADGIVFETNRH